MSVYQTIESKFAHAARLGAEDPSRNPVSIDGYGFEVLNLRRFIDDKYLRVTVYRSYLGELATKLAKVMIEEPVTLIDSKSGRPFSTTVERNFICASGANPFESVPFYSFTVQREVGLGEAVDIEKKIREAYVE